MKKTHKTPSKLEVITKVVELKEPVKVRELGTMFPCRHEEFVAFCNRLIRDGYLKNIKGPRINEKFLTSTRKGLNAVVNKIDIDSETKSLNTMLHTKVFGGPGV